MATALLALALAGCQMPEGFNASSRKAAQEAPAGAAESPAGHQTLTWVAIDTSNLGGKPSLIIPQAGAAFAEPTSFALPDGTYTLRTRSGIGLYGSFTLSSGAIVSVTDALVSTRTGVAFDVSKLNEVTIDSGILSYPLGAQSVIIPELGQVIDGRVTTHIPSGSYSVLSRGGNVSFGGFTVSGGRIVGTRDAVVGAGNDLSFDMTRLTSVTIDPSALSVPAGSQYVIIGELGASFKTATTFHVPGGSYQIHSRSGMQSFGSFKVEGGRIARTTGSLLSSGLTIFFDVVALAGLSLS